MTVYQALEELALSELQAAKDFGAQYVSRLMEGHPEAEVSCRLSRKAFSHHKALLEALREIPVEAARKEVAE